MKKKKIAVLHAQVPFVRGGAEILVETLVKQLKIRNYDAELIAIPFKWYPNNSLLDSVLAWKMVDVKETNGSKIDLVIGTKFPTYVVDHPNKVLWLMHQHRAAYDLYNSYEYAGLHTISGGSDLKSKIEVIDNNAISNIKNRYTISQNVTNRLKRYNNIAASTLYHPPSLAGRYFSEDYSNYIVSVGRLDSIKRTDLLIKALTFCDKKIKAKIAGKGIEMNNLKKLAEKLNVVDRVEFLGYVPDEDLLELYANAFAVFFAPVDEDYGYITLEALLSKKPVITCLDSGGVLEFVEDNKSGFVCSVNSEELGDKIDKLYNNKKLCCELGNFGYSKVKDISWNNVVDSLTSTLR